MRLTYLKQLLLLGLPVYFELISSVVSGIIDTFWVAPLGTSAMAGVATATTFETLLLGVVILVAVPLTILISQRAGEGKKAETLSLAHAGLVLCAVVSASVLIPCFIWRYEIAQGLLDVASGPARNVVAQYFAVMLPGTAVLFAQWTVDAVFKGHKDTRIPMQAALIANGIIIVLDPLLILAFGVIGAAWATLIGRVAGLVWSFYRLSQLSLRKVPGSAGGWREMARLGGAILRLGVPISADFLLRMFGSTMLVRIISQFDPSHVAAFGIGVKVMLFWTMAFYALRQAASILTARKRRVLRKVWRIGLACLQVEVATAAIGGLLLILCPGTIISLFTGDATVVAEGSTFLLYMAFYLAPLAVTVGMSGVLLGLRAGHSNSASPLSAQDR